MKHLLITIFILISFQFLSLHLFAGGTVTYERANQLYHNQEHEEARDLYMQMIQEGVVNGSVYYNAGNAFYKTNQIGWSVWCYLKALQYEPNNISIQENLALAQNKVSKESRLKHHTQPIDWFKSIITFHSINRWAFGALLFFSLAVCLTSIRKVTNTPAFFIAIKKVSWVLFLIYFAGMFANYIYQKTYRYGVIISNAVLYKSPKEKGITKASATEGMKVHILQQISGNKLNVSRYLVKLDNGNEVWIDETFLKML